MRSPCNGQPSQSEVIGKRRVEQKIAFCFTLLQVILHSNAYNADTKLNG